MRTLERGLVKFFDSRDEKRYGFLVLPSGEEVFFHFNDGAPVEARATEPVMLTYRAPREPRKGDTVLFQRSSGRKGPKASPWCFADEYEQAANEIAARPCYRLMKQRGNFRGKGIPLVLWEGTYLPELEDKLITVQLGTERSSDNWTKQWFEVKTPSGWQQYDGDPRTPLPSTLEFKTFMPLAVAQQELAQASRDELVDNAFGDAEVAWMRNGRLIASAYFSQRSAGVMVEATDTYQFTPFTGDQANLLRYLGKPGKSERNDAGDPRYREG